jgi:hypothetical protein
MSKSNEHEGGGDEEAMLLRRVATLKDQIAEEESRLDLVRDRLAKELDEKSRIPTQEEWDRLFPCGKKTVTKLGRKLSRKVPYEQHPKQGRAMIALMASASESVYQKKLFKAKQPLIAKQNELRKTCQEIQNLRRRREEHARGIDLTQILSGMDKTFACYLTPKKPAVVESTVVVATPTSTRSPTMNSLALQFQRSCLQ